MAGITEDQAQTMIQEIRETRREIREQADRPRTGAVSTAAIATGTPQHPAQAPYGTSGALGQDNRNFSLTKALRDVVYFNNAENAKLESEVLTRFKKGLVETDGMLVQASKDPRAIWLPMDFNLLSRDANQHEGVIFAKGVIDQSRYDYDPDEADWLIRKGQVYRKAADTSAMSAYVDARGGTLVAPPVMGPVIPLIRPQAAFLAAGATTLPLPPNGRYTEPRITSATNAKALGENDAAVVSTVGTGQMILQAKKVAGAARIPEEFTAFTSGTGDTLVKNDLERTLGLLVDAYAFYGTGGNLIPNGLTSDEYSGLVTNIANITGPAPTGLGTNGNELKPEYGDQIPALIGEKSFSMDATTGAWVMRPGVFARVISARADAVLPGDSEGTMVDILRRFAESGPTVFKGRRVVQSTNIDNTGTKGSGTGLSDVFYGIWEYALMGTYGAIQFTQGVDGNAFLQGQYLIRAVMWADVGFRYPAAFAWYPKVLGPAKLT